MSGENRLTVFAEVSNGIQTVYPISFALGYLKQKDVYVYQGEHGNYKNQLLWSWVDDNNIELAAPLPNGESFWIRRVVPRLDLNNYFESAALNPRSIDETHLQLLMLAQELMDGFGDPDGLGNIKNILDMRGYRITGLAAGIDATDAVNKAQLDVVDGKIVNALAQLDAAVAEATAQGDRAEVEANKALEQANIAIDAAQDAIDSRVVPTLGVAWLDPSEPVPKQLGLDYTTQPVISAAVDNDIVMVLTPQGYARVRIGDMRSSGSAYNVRGTLVLDNGTATISADGGVVTVAETGNTYPITSSTNPVPLAASGDAYVVLYDAIYNSLLGMPRAWTAGEIVLWTGVSWVRVSANVKSWQNKVGDVEVELGDISSDVLHWSGNTDKSVTAEVVERGRVVPNVFVVSGDRQAQREEMLLFACNAEEQAICRTPLNPNKDSYFWFGDYQETCNAAQPIMIASDKPIHGKPIGDMLLIDKPNYKGMMIFIDDVAGWVLQQGTVLGGGTGGAGGAGIPEYIDRDSNFTAAAALAYNADLYVNNIVALIEPDMPNGSWLYIRTKNFSVRPNAFMSIDFGAEVVVDNKGVEYPSMLLDRPCTVGLQKMEDGKWYVFDATGEQGNLNGITNRVEALETYPTPWEDMVPYLSYANNTTLAYELLGRREDKDTYRIKGIVRSNPFFVAGRTTIMAIPPFATLSPAQFTPCASESVVGYVKVDTVIDVIIPTGASYLIFDFTIRTTEVLL